MTDFDNSLAPPDLVVNQPEPGEPSVEELRKWSAKWLGVKATATWTRHSAWWDYVKSGVHRSWDHWEPDTDIGQAWLLVEKMLAEGMIFEISSHDSELSDWGAFFFRGGKMLGFGAEATAPLSILKACYRAAQGKETPRSAYD